MWYQNQLTELLSVRYPIIQAPMAGGPTTPALVAAVSNAGGLGSLGAGYLSPRQIREEIREIRKLTKGPFAVNLFTLSEQPPVDETRLEKMNQALDRYRKELGISTPPPLPERFSESQDEQLAVILDEKPPVFSFTFGIPPKEFLSACNKAGIVTIGTATHLEEAKVLQDSGVDVVCAQGFEAGGHRGTFIGSMEDGLVGTIALVPQLVDHLHVPVIAAGGIMDGRGIVAAMSLGAQGVQLGTAFLACTEAGTSKAFRLALTDPSAANTRITRAFSGRAARGITNRFMMEMEQHDALPYPIQNALTKDIRQAAAKLGRTEFLSMWAGQSARMARTLSARELIELLVGEAADSISWLPSEKRKQNNQRHDV